MVDETKTEIEHRIPLPTEEETKSFMDRARGAIGYELRQDLVARAIGLPVAGMFAKVAVDQPSNELLTSTTERAIATGAASTFALMGLTIVVAARHLRKVQEAERLERTENYT